MSKKACLTKGEKREIRSTLIEFADEHLDQDDEDSPGPYSNRIKRLHKLADKIKDLPEC